MNSTMNMVINLLICARHAPLELLMVDKDLIRALHLPRYELLRQECDRLCRPTLSLSIDTNFMTSPSTNPGFIHKLEWNCDKKEEFTESLVNIMPDIETIAQSSSTNLNEKQADDTRSQN